MAPAAKWSEYRDSGRSGCQQPLIEALDKAQWAFFTKGNANQ